MLDRRRFLYQLGTGLGSVALTSLLAGERARAGVLAPRPPHHPAKAKACIFLLMEGGPSHIDTFDPKPKLADLHMTEFVREKSKFASAMSSGKRYYVASPFQFQKAGESGLELCEHWEHLAGVADELCVYKGAVGESVNHPTALYHLNTGQQVRGRPGPRGLGDLRPGDRERGPARLRRPAGRHRAAGGLGQLVQRVPPPHYQGTAFRPNGSPILDLRPPDWVDRDQQRANLDLLGALNRGHIDQHPGRDDLAARVESYELAFRMQAEVPRLVDVDSEPESVRRLYGIGEDETDSFGRRCLLARRLVAAGVRFVQLYAGGWDSHDYIANAHRNRMRAVDQPIAGLITDLKRLGLLDETLIVWGGEFGRSPDNGVRGGGKQYGRDHNAGAMAFWMAGGGVKAGHVVGATDEVGASAVEVVHPLKDLHVTLLHLLGLDDNALTYFHAGRFKQLSQTGGEVIQELLA